MAQGCFFSSELCHAGALCSNGFVAWAQATRVGLLPGGILPSNLYSYVSALSSQHCPTDMFRLISNLPCISQLPPPESCRFVTVLQAGQDKFVGSHMQDPSAPEPSGLCP